MREVEEAGWTAWSGRLCPLEVAKPGSEHQLHVLLGLSPRRGCLGRSEPTALAYLGYGRTSVG